MVTLAGTQNNLKDLVEAMLKLEKNALEAYDATVERLDNKQFSQQIASFREDHYQHVESLTAIASQIGAEPQEAGGKAMLTKGKVIIADIIGNDSAILTAMKTNEWETVMAYENALKHDFLTPELRAICEKGLSDERRHRDWMDSAADSNNSKAA